MSSSNALIPWDPDGNTAVATLPENSRPEGGRWALVLNALLSPSPGRTLDRVYTSIGKVLETQANRAAHTFGLGPGIVSGKIKSYFGNHEERVTQLELLRITIPPKLEKKCLKLMKYTLPSLKLLIRNVKPSKRLWILLRYFRVSDFYFSKPSHWPAPPHWMPFWRFGTVQLALRTRIGPFGRLWLQPPWLILPFRPYWMGVQLLTLGNATKRASA
ncbi:hypothetical protein K438DRAFT_1838033 [Mycena galopus ATCC 62051]|nr:hypothetical protein K438DRAFT_1838033 [Mycena galopus ATCC 62051]